MKKVSINGDGFSPALKKKVQKSAMPLKSAELNSQQSSATQIGGGSISPIVKKHVATASKSTMGGGSFHPHIAKHVQAQ